jgi:chorismate synthase
MTFRFLTAGESHGARLTAIVEGLPAGLIDPSPRINKDLARRQLGYGRGKRMSIERDTIEISAGLIKGKTYGAPLCLHVKNSEYPTRSPDTAQPMHVPRPGHADLAGAIKFATQDVLSIWERSSARETTIRVAVGAIAKELLALANITIHSHVLSIGEVSANNIDRSQIERAEESPVRCIDESAGEAMCRAIDKATEDGDTLGGVIEVIAKNVPAGLGSCMHWDQKLDGQLAQLLMSVPSVKAVSIGDGIEGASRRGSLAHDVIQYNNGFIHPTNFAGGIEGGMTNGEEVICRAFCKPIPTLRAPLPSIDLVTKEPTRAPYKRSDVCVIPAAAVIGESMVAIALARAFLARFGADTTDELTRRFSAAPPK